MTTITLTLDSLHQIAALSAFTAPKSTHTPILTGIEISVSDSVLTAIATDRYTAARARFEHAPNEAVESVVVPSQLVTDVLKAAKGAARVHLTIDGDTLTFDWGNGRMSGQSVAGNYPPVARLLPKNPTDLPAGTAFDPTLLARLAKLTKPARSPKDRIVTFAMHAGGGSAGSANLYATGDVYDVLICPRKVAR